MRGYLRGLSSPSGTERIVTLAEAPVSNSAGHTRLPTFSRKTRSASSAARPSSPCEHMAASRWHMPPVWSWIVRTPVVETAAASTSESMSASMTATESSGESSRTVRRSVVVLPEPGEDMRFTRKVPLVLRLARSSSARRSLSAKTLCLTSRTRYPSIRMPLWYAWERAGPWCPAKAR